MISKIHSQNLYLIAVTGNFGTGKSLVGKVLTDFGILTIDTDFIVKNILSSKNNVTERIVQSFGNQVLNVTNNEYINKTVLASLVFGDECKRKILEGIIHPEVAKVLKSIIVNEKEHKLIVVLIPLLFECNLQDSYDEVWCVVCRPEVQTRRLIEKGFSLDEIKKRIVAQIPQEEKAKKSDFVIDNSDDFLKTKEQIKGRLRQLAQLNHNLHLFLDR